MKSLFVMDPFERIAVSGDSTYAIMRESTDRGHPIWACTPERLTAQDGVAWVRASRVQVTAVPPYFHVQGEDRSRVDSFDVVWMRKDPPYDMAYVLATWLLDMVSASTLVVNDPLGLKMFNEKLWAMRFGRFHPSTLLSRDVAELRAFVDALNGKAVLKPWDGNGGRGVLVTESGDKNLPAMLELLSKDGREYVIAQRYLPGIVHGDKRILLFEGEPVAALLRVPGDRDHRGNIHVGARVDPCEMDARDREICGALGPDLRKWGLFFTGIDVIEGHLTEINITSPTGIAQANRLYGLRLEADLVDRVQAAVVARRTGS